MKKSFAVWVSAVGALAFLVLSCGPDDGTDQPGSGPGSDAGVVDAGWVACDADAGVSLCAPGEACRYLESAGQTVCETLCNPDHLCKRGLVCCATENAGASGYCVPDDDCKPVSPTDGGTSGFDAGTNTGGNTDAGLPPTQTDGGNTNTGQPGDGGVTFDAGTGTGVDAGSTFDAGTGSGSVDAGTTVDAGTDVDAGSAMDAGSAVDAGTGVDAGTTVDAGTATDAGSAIDAGSAPDAGTATDAGTPTDGGTSTGSAHIRLMAANLTSGNLQSYDPGNGQRLMQGVKPDVVMIQEFNYGNNSASAIRGFVDATFGTSFAYTRESGAQIPNGVISRWPIIQSGNWVDTQVSNRSFVWARIDVPGPKDLWAISVHLLTSSSGVRNTEAQNLVKLINANIPAGDYLVIGGDFNTDSHTEAAFSTFSPVFDVKSPYPVDQNGNDGTNSSRSKPYDHVLVDPDLRQYQTTTVIGASTYSTGLVLDSRVYKPLAEIAPAQSGDSGSSNMQHMGVVKDFDIPLQ